MDLIEIRNLKTYFFKGKGLLSKLFGHGLKIVHAVDGVSLNVSKGHTFGLVGESGCGKSTLGMSILRLVEPLEGEILYKGKEVTGMDSTALRKFRQQTQLIFQDQFGCLNPRLTAAQIIAEPLMAKGGDNFKQHDILSRTAELLEAVNLGTEAATKFPHEFSGGQARRIGVARAIALKPDFIIADEPTSGLDISTAATILNLMEDMQERLDLTYLWISHNLNQVKYMSDDMAIMYLGRIVETGKTADVFQDMAHPYTQALMSAIPRVGKKDRKDKILIEGEIPSPINPPSGCRFRTRCKYAFKKCKEEEPALTHLGSGHYGACHLLETG
jgi:oligopeptide transport system ATP-binding protein